MLLKPVAEGCFSAIAASFNNRINANSKKRRSLVALLFVAGDATVSPVGCADHKEAHQSRDSLKTGKQAK
jgi:hypothetical protein